MKRFKQRGTELAMALGLFAALTCAGEVVSSAAGGWFAVDARDIKDTTLAGGVIVAGETNLVLQCSANAWGAADGGSNATVAYRNDTTGTSGTIAENTTAESVNWTPNASGTFVLTHTVATSGDPVELSATFAVPFQVGDNAWASFYDGTCTIRGTGETSGSYPAWEGRWADVKDVRVEDGITGIGEYNFHKFYNLTNVTIAASCTRLGEGAFFRCLSLEQITFDGEMPERADNALVIHAGIRMEGDQPIVYAVPNVTLKGSENGLTLMGSNDLENWEAIDPADATNYHFFKFTVGD